MSTRCHRIKDAARTNFCFLQSMKSTNRSDETVGSLYIDCRQTALAFISDLEVMRESTLIRHATSKTQSQHKDLKVPSPHSGVFAKPRDSEVEKASDLQWQRIMIGIKKADGNGI